MGEEWNGQYFQTLFAEELLFGGGTFVLWDTFRNGGMSCKSLYSERWEISEREILYRRPEVKCGLLEWFRAPGDSKLALIICSLNVQITVDIQQISMARILTDYDLNDLMKAWRHSDGGGWPGEAVMQQEWRWLPGESVDKPVWVRWGCCLEKGEGSGVKQRGVRLCWTLNIRQKAWNGRHRALCFHSTTGMKSKVQRLAF